MAGLPSTPARRTVAGRLRLAPLALALWALGAVAPAQDDGAEAGEECTVGVAAARATADGRPLLWKNRDAQKRHNVVTAFDDGTHAYVAICDSGSRSAVWGGANAAGFCIMNSVSRDLPQGSDKGPANGGFMKLALQRCASVEEFVALLEATNRTGRRTRANFGVIDAAGGAAFFETSHRAYRRFDAEDAASGVLVRTNFATTANGERGRERFARATELCKAPPGGKLDHVFLLQRFCRDLEAPPGAQTGEGDRRDVRETLHRQTTVAAMVFHGVRKGEPAAATTMWAILGQPLFSVAVPCFPAAGGVSPTLAGAPRSPLCDLALELQGAFYDPSSAPAPAADERQNEGEAEVAGAIRWLRTEGLGTVQQEILRAERAILDATATKLAELRRAGDAPIGERLRALHDEQAGRALAALRKVAESQLAAPR